VWRKPRALFARLFCLPCSNGGQLLLLKLRHRAVRNCAPKLAWALMFTISAGAALSAFSASSFAAMATGNNDAKRVFTDEAGRQLEVPARVRRIVTLSPDLTETIYALGLEDRLVGDTNYCDTPAAAKQKPHIGQPLNPSLEAIVALQPDLVLASTSINRRETVDALAKLGMAVYTSNPRTVRGVLASITRMAQVMGADSQGNALVARLQARLDKLQARLGELPLIHVLFVVWEEPLISIGQNTFIADALRWAGAESIITSHQNWPQISLEEVVRLQPDYILFTNNHGGNPKKLDDVRSRPAWRSLRAVELGHVIVSTDEIARPSSGLVDAIEQLARKLHPEVFSVQMPDDSTGIGIEMPPLDFGTMAKECDACAR
jgi:iron complex transport system substrate-binding protein